MISRSDFEKKLNHFGFHPTDRYLENGEIRLWQKADGELVPINCYPHYPSVYLEKILDEYVGGIPSYTTNQ